MNKQEAHRANPEKYKKSAVLSEKEKQDNKSNVSFPLPLEKRKDVMGKYRTASLFIEKNNSDKWVPEFTLEGEDRWIDGPLMYGERTEVEGTIRHFISLKQIYLSFYEDPTEYDFAMYVFSDWSHWERLCSAPFFKEHIDMWRKEAEIKLRSKMIKEMTNTALNEGAKGTIAAKWIAEGRYKGSGAGRPSNRDKATQKEIDDSISSEVEDDVKRLLHLKVL